MTEPLEQIAGYGVVGALLVVALYALWRKDLDLRAESAARVEDAQRMLTLAMTLQKDVTTAVASLTEIVEKWERREEERERLVREAAMQRIPTPGPMLPPPIPRGNR